MRKKRDIPIKVAPLRVALAAPAAMGPEELDDVFDSVARYFSLLAEPTRLKILHTICHDERSVSSIVAATGATQTNVSRHLSLMHQAGVVSRRRDGSTVYYKVLDPEFARDLPHRLRAHRGPHRGRRAVEARVARFRCRALAARRVVRCRMRAEFPRV